MSENMENSVRTYCVTDRGVARVLPYPGRSEDSHVINPELQTAEQRMYLSKLTAVCARVKMRKDAGFQPSRDEVAQIERYSSLLCAAGEIPSSKVYNFA